MKIKRNIWILGFVSMLNDITSEAIIPLLPAFVTQVLGAGPEILGLISGVAKATNSVSRPIFGFLSDKLKKRKPLVVFGYLTSIIGRFVVAISVSWPFVLVGRFIDRIGKGMRTPARDAMIAEFSSREIRGSAFGVHRALDTTGAVFGPLLALLLLPAMPGLREKLGLGLSDLNLLFLTMLIPSIIALPLFYFVKETRFKPGKQKIRLSPKFKKFMVPVIIFSIANFPISFLILRSSDFGLNLENLLVLYILFNVIYAITAYPAGRMIDKLGSKISLMIAFGLLGFISLGLSLPGNVWMMVILFLAYGVFMATYQVSIRSFTSFLGKKENLGTTFGTLDLVIGIGSLISGIMIGGLWASVGPGPTFGVMSFISFLSVLAILVFI